MTNPTRTDAERQRLMLEWIQEREELTASLDELDQRRVETLRDIAECNRVIARIEGKLASS